MVVLSLVIICCVALLSPVFFQIIASEEIATDQIVRTSIYSNESDISTQPWSCGKLHEVHEMKLLTILLGVTPSRAMR